MNKTGRTNMTHPGNYIIGNGIPEAPVCIIEQARHRIPDLYSDALALKYGFGVYDPISEKEIAEIYSEENNIKMTEDLVYGIINDALFMVNYEPEEFETINLSEELPADISDSLHGKDLSWNMIARMIYGYTEEDEMDRFLSETFGDADYVIAPRIDSIYFTYSPRWTDIAGFDTVLTNIDVLDYRGMAEFVINKLDKMGVCVVCDVFRLKKIQPDYIYAYAYLETDLAMKIIRDNPIRLIEKIKQSR